MPDRGELNGEFCLHHADPADDYRPAGLEYTCPPADPCLTQGAEAGSAAQADYLPGLFWFRRRASGHEIAERQPCPGTAGRSGRG